LKPKLISINGNPGMGKSTLAQRYIDEHPLTLNVDVDVLWWMMGQWQSSRPRSSELKRKYAYALVDMHLAEGLDVIVPDHIANSDQYVRFEKIARANDAIFKEVVLISNLDDAIERCKSRGRLRGYKDGFRPGGILDTSGRELKLTRMYEGMLATVALRENMIYIESADGDIDGTYSRLIAAIDS
jgi:adenylate kinase family enzyme